MAKDVIARLKADTSQWDSGISQAIRSMNKFKSECLNMNNVVGSMSKSLVSLASSYVGPVAAFTAITGAIASNIQTAKEFEKSMSSLSSLTGMTGDALDDLKRKAIELGGSTTQSASQVAESFQLIGSKMPELLKDANALQAVTRAAITLAEASGGDVTTSANALTAALNIMGEGADQATRYINVMAATSQQGTRSIQELTDIVFRAGQNARATGVSFEELMAIAGAGTKEFASAEQAGQALGKLFLQLEKQGDSNLKPSVVGLTSAIENLTTANLSTVEATKLFTQNGAAAYMSIIHNKEAILDLLPNIQNTNVAEEQAAINTDNLDGSLNRLSSAWEELNLTINDGNGIIRTCVDFTTELVSETTALINAFGNGIDNMDTFFADLEQNVREMAPFLSDMLDDLNEIAAFVGFSGGTATKDKKPNAGSVDAVTGASVNANATKPSEAKTIEPQQVFDDSTEEGIKAHIKHLKELRETADIAGQEYANLTAEITRLQSIISPNIKSGQQIKGFNVKDKSSPLQFGDMSASLDDLKKLQSYWNNLANSTTNSFVRTDALNNAKDVNKQIVQFDMTVSEKALADLREQVQSMLNETPPLEIDATFDTKNVGVLGNDAKQVAENFQKATSSVASLGSAMQQLEDPGAKVAGIIAQAIATIAQTFAFSLKGTATPWDWIAGAISGTATMISTISAIKSAVEYHADGGVVGGSPFIPRGTDTVPAMLTPGEIVLNAAQQKSLASNLEGLGETSIQATTIETKFKGEDLVSVINVHARRTNRKEILQ